MDPGSAQNTLIPEADFFDLLDEVSWLGTLTSSSIVYLSRRNTDPESALHGWGILLMILLSEHIYLLARMVVAFVLSKFESPGLQNERRERYNMKKRLLREHLDQDVVVRVSTPNVEIHDKLTQDLLEAEARAASMSGERKLEEAFWHRQTAMRETIDVGRDYIQEVSFFPFICLFSLPFALLSVATYTLHVIDGHPCSPPPVHVPQQVNFIRAFIFFG